MATKRPLEYDASSSSSKQAKIDLNYPISTSSNVSSITPPFIQPPFNASNGELSISVTNPLSIENGSVTLNYDNTMETNLGKLSVKIDPQGPIDPTENGLTLLLGDGIEEDEYNHITLKIAIDQPLDVSNGGLSVLYDNQTIGTNGNSINGQQELEVRLEENGGLEKSTNGISVKCDSTLTTDENGLGVVCNPNGPITADDDGIDIDIDQNALTINQSTNGKELSVLLNSNGAITLDQGLKLNIDTTSLAIRNNMLSSLLSVPKYVITSGSTQLDNFSTAQVMAKIGLTNTYLTFRCAYYARLVSDGNVVNGILLVKLRSSDTTAVPTEQQSSNPSFTFWLCRDLDGDSALNYSNCTSNGYTPDAVSAKQNTVPFYDAINAWVGSNNSNWYVGDVSNTTIYGKPNGGGNLSNTYVSSVNFSIVRVNSNSSRPPQLAFTINLLPTGSNTNKLYALNNVKDNVTVGPIVFSYLVNPN